MKINHGIQNALRQAISKAGTQVLLSQKCGVRQNLFSMYLHGNIKEIEHENWLKLYPYLEEFLPEHMREKKAADALPTDEQLLLECYRRFTDEEKQQAVKDFIIKDEVKKMRKTG